MSRLSIGSSAHSLFADGESFAKGNIATSIYQHPKSVNRKLMINIQKGFYPKLKLIKNYGLKNFPHGILDGSIIDYNYIESDVQGAIETDLGYAVSILWIEVETPVVDYFAKNYAKRVWGLNESTNILHKPPVTSVKKYPAKLKSYRWVSNSQIEFSIKYTTVQYTGGPPIYTDHIHTLQKKITVYGNDIDERELYFHVKYKSIPSSETRYWFYCPELEQRHSALDASLITEASMQFLPLIPIRRNNVNLGPEFDEDDEIISKPDTDLYKHSKILCKKFDVDFNEICKLINNNPNVKDIDHAYLTFGINIRNETEGGKAYIYEFFNALAGDPKHERSVWIKDLEYKIKISYSSISSQDIVGELSSKNIIEYDEYNLIIKHQLNSTTYREITVIYPRHHNYIYGSRNVETTLIDSADEDNHNFNIPLSNELVKRINNFFYREEAVKESVLIITNSWEKRSSKWYEKGIVKFAIFIAVIAYALYTGDLANALQFMAYIAATYTIIGLIIYLALVYAISKLIQMVLVEIAEEWGAEWAIVAAIAIAVFAYNFEGMQFESITYNNQVFPSVINFMAIQNSALMGIQQHLRTEQERAYAEYTAEMERIEEELNELEKLNEELDSDAWFNISTFISVRDFPKKIETPEEYYNRKIHVGNVGIASLSVIEKFVETKLKLPERLMYERKS